jgi:hypothetical protein
MRAERVRPTRSRFREMYSFSAAPQISSVIHLAKRVEHQFARLPTTLYRQDHKLMNERIMHSRLATLE